MVKICGKLGFFGIINSSWWGRRSRMFDVWKNVLAKIEKEIPSSAFSTWFNGVELVSIENKKAKIGIPNVFYKKQLESRYHKLIKDAFFDSGVEIEAIEYIVKSSSKTKIRAREVTNGDFLNVSSRVEKIKQELPKNTSLLNSNLNPKYQMNNFVIGSNNDLAVSVAKSVIKNPGSSYNPFFLYGGPGLGKTHLVQAIGNEIKREHPEFKVLYISTDHFYADFVNSIKNGKGDEFNRKFRKLDVLIIDDFQQIMGKDRSQEEFFNIFNDLYQLNKQIIVTSDRLPNQIKTLDERLSSRLSMAGAIDLQMPNFEDKCAILKSKAEFMGREIENEAIEYLAENVKTNIRDLEGEFMRVLAFSDFKGMTPLELINEGIISPVKAVKNRAVQPKQIIEKVAKYYNLTTKEMCGKSRVSHIKTARQVAMFLLSEELQMSTPKIAFEVGVKDHTTVMHGVKKIKADMKLNFSLRDQIEDIREKIYG